MRNRSIKFKLSGKVSENIIKFGLTAYIEINWFIK